jgi:hypothetical protein
MYTELNGFPDLSYVRGWVQIKAFFLVKTTPFAYFIAAPLAPGGHLKISLVPLATAVPRADGRLCGECWRVARAVARRGSCGVWLVAPVWPTAHRPTWKPSHLHCT